MIGLIKKFINSDFSKPLNTLILERYNDLFGKVNEANTNAYDSLQKGQEIVNMIGSGRVVKSVQRGVCYIRYGTGSINLSHINPYKAIVLLNGVLKYGEKSGDFRFALPCVSSLQSSKLEVRESGVPNGLDQYTPVSWQVIEFY